MARQLLMCLVSVDGFKHDNRIVLAKGRFHGVDQARQFHRKQKLRKEALLGALEYRERHSLGVAIERITAVFVDHPCGFECLVEIAVDDRP